MFSPPPVVRRIGDWELSGQWRPTPLKRADTLDEPASVPIPGQARQLIDLVAPYLAVVSEAMAPQLAAHGLSLAEAAVEDLLAIDGLADEVVRTAREAVARVEVLGLHPSEVVVHRGAPDVLPAGWRFEASSNRPSLQGLLAEPPPLASPVRPLPAGWQAHVDAAPRHLKFDEQGEPCYPDAPPFEDFWPKCPEPETMAPPAEVPCREDARFLRAEARLRERRHFDRLPSSFRGFDYRARLAESVSLPVDALYRCGKKPGSPNTLASWFGPPGAAVIRLYERFLDLEVEWDLLGVLAGPVDFRAAVLLHEHVHRIEDPQMGSVAAPSDRGYHPVGSAGQDDCPWSGAEYDAAYLQALYLGGSEAVARLVGDIYGRAQCGRLSRSAQLLAAADDIVEVLAPGWLQSLEVIVALTVRLSSDPEDGIRVLASLFPSDLAALMGLRLWLGSSGRSP